MLLGASLLPLSCFLIGFSKSRVVVPTAGPHARAASASGLHEDSRERGPAGLGVRWPDIPVLTQWPRETPPSCGLNEMGLWPDQLFSSVVRVPW